MFQPDEIVQFWFESLVNKDDSLAQKRAVWFSLDLKRDRMLRRRFMSMLMLALEDGLSFWPKTHTSILAKIILLDRVAKSCYRGTPLLEDFATAAITLCKDHIERGQHKRSNVLHQIFILLPLLSSPRIKDQEAWQFYASTIKGTEDENELLAHLKSFSERNSLVLQKFGRFPHQAKALRQTLTVEEKSFVTEYQWEMWL